MSYLVPIPENIPADLAEKRGFLVWRGITKPGNPKPSKEPYQARNPEALGSSTNPKTWAPFTEAVRAYQNPANKLDGIGIAMFDGLCGVDFDHCIDADGIDPVVLEWVKRFNTYAERSPSGDGIRVIGLAKFEGEGKKRGNREIYCGGRYLTLTGHHLDGTPTTVNNSPAMLEFRAMLVAEEGANKPKNTTPSTEEVVFSCECGVRKPSLGIFRLACQRLSVGPDECWFVDDRVKYLVGAKEAGLVPILIQWRDGDDFPTSSEEVEPWSGRRINHLAAL